MPEQLAKHLEVLLRMIDEEGNLVEQYIGPEQLRTHEVAERSPDRKPMWRVGNSWASA